MKAVFGLFKLASMAARCRCESRMLLSAVLAAILSGLLCRGELSAEEQKESEQAISLQHRAPFQPAEKNLHLTANAGNGPMAAANSLIAASYSACEESSETGILSEDCNWNVVNAAVPVRNAWFRKVSLTRLSSSR